MQNGREENKINCNDEFSNRPKLQKKRSLQKKAAYKA